MRLASEVLDHITGAVDYLRISVGDDDSTEWLACSRLCSDPTALAALARSTAVDYGTERDDVAMSLLVQGYAFRIASLAVGAWLLDDVVLDVDPAGTAVAMGRHGPNAVRVDEPTIDSAADPVGALHAGLIDRHLAALVGTAHEAVRVGETLLWTNVGASCAAAFATFKPTLASRRGLIHDRARAFFERARPDLAGSGRIVPIGADWAWERAACCLWYQAAGGSRCADCSLWSPAERQARYAAEIRAQAK